MLAPMPRSYSQAALVVDHGGEAESTEDDLSIVR
jgi:hypothetical protein